MWNPQGSNWNFLPWSEWFLFLNLNQNDLIVFQWYLITSKNIKNRMTKKTFLRPLDVVPVSAPLDVVDWTSSSASVSSVQLQGASIIIFRFIMSLKLHQWSQAIGSSASRSVKSILTAGKWEPFLKHCEVSSSSRIVKFFNVFIFIVKEWFGQLLRLLNPFNGLSDMSRCCKLFKFSFAKISKSTMLILFPFKFNSFLGFNFIL